MNTIEYRTTVAGIAPDQLDGFFVGWPDPPTATNRLAILAAASGVVVAVEPDGSVVGFATAITDNR